MNILRPVAKPKATKPYIPVKSTLKSRPSTAEMLRNKRLSRGV